MRSYLFTGLALGAALMLASKLIAGFFQEPRLTNLFVFLAIDIPLFAFTKAYQAIWIGRGEFTLRATMSFVRLVVRLVLVVLLVVGGYSLFGAILANVGATLAEAAYAFSKRPINPLRGSARASQRVFAVIRPLALFVLAMRLFANLDLLSLRVLGISLNEVGLYGAARNLSVIPGIFSLSFAPLLLSTLNKNVAHGQLSTAQLIAKDALRVALGLFPFAGIVVGSSRELVVFVLGSEFGEAAQFLNLLILAAVFQTYFSISSAILLAAKSYRPVAVLGVSLLALSLFLYLLLVPGNGPLAAAWIITALSITASFTGHFLIHYRWDAVPHMASLVRSGLLTLGAFAVSAVWKTTGLLIPFELALLSIAVVLGFIISGEVNRSERDQAMRLLSDAGRRIFQN